MPSTKRPAPRSASPWTPRTPPRKRIKTSDSPQKATRSSTTALEPDVIEVFNRAVDYANTETKYWKSATKEAKAETKHWKSECDRWSDRAMRSEAAMAAKALKARSARLKHRSAERRCARLLARLATYKDVLLQIGGLSKRTTDGKSRLHEVHLRPMLISYVDLSRPEYPFCLGGGREMGIRAL